MNPTTNDDQNRPAAPVVEKNKRISPRIDIASVVAYVMVDGNKRILGKGVARVVNLSRGGLKLQTREFVKPLFILLSLARQDEKPLTILGKVTHCEEIGGGIFHSGVKFLEDEEKSKKVVIGLVKAHVSRKNPPQQG